MAVGPQGGQELPLVPSCVPVMFTKDPAGLQVGEEGAAQRACCVGFLSAEFTRKPCSWRQMCVQVLPELNKGWGARALQLLSRTGQLPG